MTGFYVRGTLTVKGLNKARLLDVVLSLNQYFANYISPHENVTTSEFKVLRYLAKNKASFRKQSKVIPE